MKTSQFYWVDNNKHEIWHEYANGSTHYFMRINGISKSITERQYKNRIKKHNLKNLD
jgi:hypothetical protein